MKAVLILSVVIPILIYIFTTMLFMVLQPLCVQQILPDKESLLPHTSLDLKKIFGYSLVPVGTGALLFLFMW